jgi:hypothetical protein
VLEAPLDGLCTYGAVAQRGSTHLAKQATSKTRDAEALLDETTCQGTFECALHSRITAEVGSLTLLVHIRAWRR